MRNVKGIQVLGLSVVLAVAACANVDPNARRDNAWSQRLTAQTAAIQAARARQERSNVVWAERLNAMAIAYRAEQARRQRADAAASQRLTKLAEYIRNGGHVN